MVFAEPCAECSEKWRTKSAKARGSSLQLDACRAVP